MTFLLSSKQEFNLESAADGIVIDSNIDVEHALSLIDEFHTQNAIQIGQHCFVSSDQKQRSGGVVVETKDIEPAIASKLREGVLVPLEDPFMPTELSLNREEGNFEFKPIPTDENNGITHAMKKGDVTVLANCSPAQFF